MRTGVGRAFRGMGSLSSLRSSSLSSSNTQSSREVLANVCWASPGMLPRLTGVLTGRFKSKTSGESMGPKVTLFLDRLAEGSPVLWMLPDTVDSGRFLAGDGV